MQVPKTPNSKPTGPQATGPRATGAAPAAARPANRLAKESSPYLLLHAHNPVDWYPWGEEALAKAKREKKLIFLSIGYSSCYWCHVMERELFLNDEIAGLLNKHFVAIKVDREERPDIDEVYMRSLQVYSQLAGAPQGGGWPLTMFLSPDAKPLVGGTYFPPHDREGRSGLVSVLKLVHERWKADPAQWQKTADQIAGYVRQSLASRPVVVPPVKLEPGLVAAVQQALAHEYDREYGGFGYSAENPRRPKFPEPPNLEFLLDRVARVHDAAAREMVLGTLDKMAAGGIRDHLGGGFHRYSTDRYWRVPHFEKMLYDNAQLVAVYARAFELDPRDEYRRVADEALAFVGRELTDPEGGFYSAIDAETDGQEGIYYSWLPGEIKAALAPDQFALASSAFALDAKPNFEQRYVLARAMTLDELAKARRQSVAQLLPQLRGVEDKLLAVRQQRVRPLTDTKVLAGWNGLMIRGYADAGRVWKNPRYLATAARAAEFLLANLPRRTEGCCAAIARGRARCRLFSTTMRSRSPGCWRCIAPTAIAAGSTRPMPSRAISSLDSGTSAAAASTSPPPTTNALFARSKVSVDGVMPSGNSVSAANLIALGRTLSKPEYLERARETIAAAAPLLKDSPSSAPQMAVSLAELLAEAADGPAGRNDRPDP